MLQESTRSCWFVNTAYVDEGFCSRRSVNTIVDSNSVSRLDVTEENLFHVIC